MIEANHARISLTRVLRVGRSLITRVIEFDDGARPGYGVESIDDRLPFDDGALHRIEKLSSPQRIGPVSASATQSVWPT